MILNKVDLVSWDDSENFLEELEKEIHGINSLANIIHSTRCQVDLSRILNRQEYDATVSLLVFPYVSRVFIVKVTLLNVVYINLVLLISAFCSFGIPAGRKQILNYWRNS